VLVKAGYIYLLKFEHCLLTLPFACDNVVVASQLRAAVRDVDSAHWQKCLSSWSKLQRAASRPCCNVNFIRNDDNCKLTSDSRSAVDNLQLTAASQLQRRAEDIGSKSALKRPSADLVTFRVSAKCAGRTSSFNSQVLLISYQSLQMVAGV